MHLFARRLLAREATTLFLHTPDSLYQPKLILSDLPRTLATGVTINVKVTLPLPWATSQPQTLTLAINDCATGAVSPSTIVLSGATQSATFSLRLPTGSQGVTLTFNLTGGAVKRYSAPSSITVVPFDTVSLLSIASFGTNFPLTPISSGLSWSIGASPASGIITFASTASTLRYDAIADVGTVTAPHPLTLPIESGFGFSVAAFILIPSNSGSGAWWRMADASGNTLSFQLNGALGIKFTWANVSHPTDSYTCTGGVLLNTLSWIHAAFTLSPASILSLYIDGVRIAACRWPFIANSPFTAATATQLTQDSKIASLHFFPFQLSKTDVALLAGQSPPSLYRQAPLSAADLIARSAFHTNFSSQLGWTGWLEGQAGSGGMAVQNYNRSGALSYIDYSSANSIDVGTSKRWPANMTIMTTGVTIASDNKTQTATACMPITMVMLHP